MKTSFTLEGLPRKLDGGVYYTMSPTCRSPLDEIVNKIALHYNRDATRDGDEAYRALIQISDAVSIARYSEYEKSDLFYFDFVQDATMADDAADFYLARLACRKKLIELLFISP
jgi:hypothetical protein